jgi:benzodiazapine receptor
MGEIASKGQLRLAYLRWAMVTVPLILLLGFASGRMVPSGDENRWFAQLTKPGIMPPGWAFPVAWAILYVLMGLALAMIVNARGSRGRGLALAVFALQLVLNLAWTPVFFGLHKVDTALLMLATLVPLVLLTILLFRRVRGGAALLLVPYLAWLCFAFVLLYQLDALNPNAGSLVPSRSADQIEIR